MYSDTAKRDAHHVRDMDGYKVRAGGHDSRNYMEFKRFLELFMSLSGETLQQKGETFLKQYADLTDSEMATIRNILIEKKKQVREA